MVDPDSQPLRVGSMVGRYRVDAHLDHVAGHAFEGWDTALDRPVTLLLTPAGSGEAATWMARASSSHERLVDLYDSCAVGDRTCHVLERPLGPTLRERLARGALVADDAMQVAIRVADIVAHAERAGLRLPARIDERDVFLTAHGFVKLRGFAAEEDEPGCAHDDREREASQIGSMARMLIEMLTGDRRDWDAQSYAAISERIVELVNPWLDRLLWAAVVPPRGPMTRAQWLHGLVLAREDGPTTRRSGFLDNLNAWCASAAVLAPCGTYCRGGDPGAALLFVAAVSAPVLAYGFYRQGAPWRAIAKRAERGSAPVAHALEAPREYHQHAAVEGASDL